MRRVPRRMCWLLAMAGVVCLSTFGGRIEAQAAPIADSLQIAGVAFLPSDSLFPIARAIMARADAQNTPLSGVMVAAFRAAAFPVRTDYAVRKGRALAFAFDDEYQVVDKVLDKYRVITVISAQLLTIDFRTQQAVSAMPVTVDFIDMSSTPPDDAMRARTVADLTKLFTNAGPDGPFAQSAEVFRNLIPPSEGGCLVRIGTVAYDKPTADAIVGRVHGDTLRLNRLLASLLSRTWMTAARQPILPSGGSQARDQMMGRFSDTEMFLLKIPSADYNLSFVDIQTKRGIAGQNAVLRVEGIGMQVKLVVTDAVLNMPVTSGTYRTVKMDTLSVLSPPTDGWVAVSNTLKSLTAGIGAAAQANDRKWLVNNDVDKTSFPSLPQWIKQRCGS